MRHLFAVRVPGRAVAERFVADDLARLAAVIINNPLLAITVKSGSALEVLGI